MNATERQLVSFATASGSSPLVVVAAVSRAAAALHYRLRIAGAGLAPSEPAAGGPARRDGLWRHTCAELFVAVPGRSSYLEWNLSPCGGWNLYRFDDYRAACRAEASIRIAAPSTARIADTLIIEGRLALGPLGLADQVLEVGVSAVVESVDGELSWWALCHPAARPDFHDRRGFTLQLAVGTADQGGLP